ncbi:MAG: hypothetical protein S4CHLAM102_10640 [Chlamydiia bacterium]|nr:hypothetical protein [Chlamydiia bacterium]
MFEFSLLKKYLIPKRKQLTVSLIATMSIIVISLVVWLLLLFLSITEGIEKNWLKKLTSLNAPIRISPTEAYYNSYYYQSDRFSSEAGYVAKNIREKLHAELTDPYDPEHDEELPPYVPARQNGNNGKPLDLVKEAFASIDGLKKNHPRLQASDYEITGSLLRLRMLRPEMGDQQSFLTQVSYLCTFFENIPTLKPMILPPSADDINHLLYLSNLSSKDGLSDSPTVQYAPDGLSKRAKIFNNCSITSFVPRATRFTLPMRTLPQQRNFHAAVHFSQGQVDHLIVMSEKGQKVPEGYHEGLFTRGEQEGRISAGGHAYSVPLSLGISFDHPLEFRAQNQPGPDMRIDGKAMVQGHAINHQFDMSQVRLTKVDPTRVFDRAPAQEPLWTYFVEGNEPSNTIPMVNVGEHGIVVSKHFRDQGVRLGDRGYLAYSASTTSNVQEQRVPVVITGFYDPGIMSIGARYILLPNELVSDISQATNAMSMDPLMSNGIGVWLDDLDQTREVAAKLNAEFEKRGIAPYWKVTTFYEYDFAKDLLQQFQSDKYLFTLIGMIILTIACTNIISLLLLLVNDKRREIGILQSMGASTRSLAMTFGLCGMTLGLVSCILGAIAAIMTLTNIDSLVQLLSFMQGHDAFNQLFYGSSLPKTLSHKSLIITLIATPIISLIAGLIPAVKACRMTPSKVLRSE